MHSRMAYVCKVAGGNYKRTYYVKGNMNELLTTLRNMLMTCE